MHYYSFAHNYYGRIRTVIIKEKTKLDPNLEFVKVVVDIEKEILAAVCELHIDCYDELVQNGSESENLWGANINLKKKAIEFISMINIRPPRNAGMEIKDQEIRNKVERIIKNLILYDH